MNQILEKIRGHIGTCPLFRGESLNVDYIGEDMSYSIDPLPCEPMLKKYADGGSMRQYQFSLTSKEYYDLDARVNIDNSTFYQDFEDWLEAQDVRSIDIGGLYPYKYETINKGYLYESDGSMARYRIDCRLIYIKKGL